MYDHVDYTRKPYANKRVNTSVYGHLMQYKQNRVRCLCALMDYICAFTLHQTLELLSLILFQLI